MLARLKRLAYRDRVLAHLDALLLMYPPRRQFAADFPWLRAAIRSHFEDGVSDAASALQLAASIIAELLRTLGAEERAAVVARLRALDRPALEALASRRIGHSYAPPPDPIGLAAELVGVAIYIAERMVEERAIGRRNYDAFVEILEASLPGLNPLPKGEGAREADG